MMRVRTLVLMLIVVLATALTATASANPPELINMRTQSAKYFPVGKGQIRADFYTGPVHYKDGRDSWQDIDLSVVNLSRVSDDGRNFARLGIETGEPSGSTNEFGLHENARGELRLFKQSLGLGTVKNTFGFIGAKDAKGTFVFALDRSKRIIFQALNTENSSAEKKQRNGLAYRNAWKNSHLEYEVLTDGAKESVVLQSRDVPAHFEFRLKAYGLSPHAKDGSIQFIDEKGDIQVVITAPFMMDAKGNFSDRVDQEIRVNGRNIFLTVTPDKTWLDDPERSFPIVMDPSIALYSKQTSGDAYIDSGAPTRAKGSDDPNKLVYGYYDGLLLKSFQWVLLQFPDLGLIPSTTYIHQALLQLQCKTMDKTINYMGNVATCATPWQEQSVKWNDIGTESPALRDSFIIPNVTGLWQLPLRGSTVRELMSDENLSLVLYSFPWSGFSRTFYSKEGAFAVGQSTYAPALSVIYSELPVVSSPIAETPIVSSTDPDVQAMGVYDKLKLSVKWQTSLVDMNDNAINRYFGGKVELTDTSTGVVTSKDASAAVGANCVEFGNLSGAELHPFKSYSAKIFSWCAESGHDCYDAANSNTYVTVDVPGTIDTSLHYTSYDWSNNPENLKYGNLPWTTLSGGHSVDVQGSSAAHPNGNECSIRFATDTRSVVKVKYWENGSNDTYTEMDSRGDGYLHEVLLTNLTRGKTYQYQIETSFSWDAAGDHTAISATGEFTATPVTFSLLPVTTVEQNPPLVSSTFEWSTPGLVTNGFVVLWADGQTEKMTFSDPNPNSTSHKVIVKLSPGIQYHYQVGCNKSLPSEAATFKTPFVGRGIESYYNIINWSLGSNGNIGVNTGNGNLIVTRPVLAMAGRGPALAVAQIYNRNSSEDSVLGPGWRMSYESTVVFDDMQWAVVTDDDGSNHVFPTNSIGGYDSARGKFSKFESASGGYRITAKDGTKLQYGMISGLYRLTQITDRFENALFITRDQEGRIQSLRRSPSSSAEVQYYYDLNGKLDYLVTKADPATGKAYKVDYTVNVTSEQNVPKWSEVKTTLMYATTTEGQAQPTTTYHMDSALNNIQITDAMEHITKVTLWPDLSVNTISANYTYYTETSTTRNTPGIRTTTLSYGVGGVTTLTNGNGNSAQFIHNPDLTVNTISYPNNSSSGTAKLLYNNDFKVIEESHNKDIDQPGLFIVTKYYYDTFGNLTSQISDYNGTDPKTQNTTSVFTYEPKYQQIETAVDPRQYSLDPQEVSVNYVYDPVTAVLKRIEPQGSASLSPANYYVELDYYSNYDVHFKRIYNTNANEPGALSTIQYEYGYDTFGQLEEVFYLDNGAKKLVGFYRRDMFGRLLYRVDANGTIVRCNYNKNGLLESETRPKAIDATTLRDEVNARLSSFGFALLVETMSEPNPDFDLVRVLTYDANCQPLSETDAKGRVTSKECDELGQLTKVTVPLGLVTFYRYDAVGNLEWKRYPAQTGYALARHFYDGLEREAASYDPSIGAKYEETNEFDLAGNVVAVNKGVQQDNTYASRTEYLYDALNRCTQISYLDSTGAVVKVVTTEYDRNGNAKKQVSPVFAPGENQGTLERINTYDAVNRLVEEQVTNSDPAFSTYNYHAEYQYGGGRLLSESLHDPDGLGFSSTTYYTYDAAARLRTLTKDGRTFVFDYYPNGSRKKLTYGNQMTADYVYDRVGRLLNLNYTWGPTMNSHLDFGYSYYEDGKVHTETQSGAGGVLAANLKYVGDDDTDADEEGTTYPAGGNLFPTTSRTTTYTYDDLGRLTHVDQDRICGRVPNKTYDWQYDAMGNRKSETTVEGSYSYHDKLGDKTVTSTTYAMTNAYDQVTGNRLVSSSGTITVAGTEPSRTSVSKNYSYGVLGNQNSVITASMRPEWESPSVTGIATSYNELWKVSAQDGTKYYYDGNGTELREDNQYYFYSTEGVSRVLEGEISKNHSYARIGGQLLASNDGFFYIVNARGDVVCLISDGAFKTRDNITINAGNVLAYYVYEPFGGLRAAQKELSAFNKFKFAGGLQSNTGNYLFGARVYTPSDGCWISMDGYRGSVGDPISLNRYAYCSNDPVNYVDPSGFSPSYNWGGGGTCGESSTWNGNVVALFIGESAICSFGICVVNLELSLDTYARNNAGTIQVAVQMTATASNGAPEAGMGVAALTFTVTAFASGDPAGNSVGSATQPAWIPVGATGSPITTSFTLVFNIDVGVLVAGSVDCVVIVVAASAATEYGGSVGQTSPSVCGSAPVAQ